MRAFVGSGQVVTLNANSQGAEADLWWAVRGGGGGNFGVTVEMTFQLHEQPSPTILAGELCWPITPGPTPSTSHTVMKFVQSTFAPNAPNEMAIYGTSPCFCWLFVCVFCSPGPPFFFHLIL